VDFVGSYARRLNDQPRLAGPETIIAALSVVWCLSIRGIHQLDCHMPK